jgi:CRISPR-associated protein Csm1
MNDIRDNIYLGALLHDIGKFYQRADKSYYDSDDLSSQSKRIAQLICPLTQNGYYSHQHVIWTNEFFEKYENLFAKYALKKEVTDNVANLASYHHRPASLYQAMVQMADWWASGLDRSMLAENSTELKTGGKERFKEIPLSNIFSALKVKINENDRIGKSSTNASSFKLRELSLDRESVFPTGFTFTSREEYENLWNKFAEKLDVRNFNTSSAKDFGITLFYILKQYTWCIPSFTQEDYPCISLFEHLKITSAIAQCFYDYYSENPSKFIFDASKSRLKLTDEAFPLQLVCFDLSGIQGFLYNISSVNAAKSLRGRSFYIQMLLESLSWYLIREIPESFTPSHIVYASGGKFYMLLPNTSKVDKLLSDIKIKVEEDLWKRHKGELYLNIGKTAFRYDNDIKKDKPNVRIEGENENVFLGTLWERVFQSTIRDEGRKYAELISSGKLYDQLFKPSGAGGNEKTCSVTGLEYKTEDLYVKSKTKEQVGWVSATKADNLDDCIFISKYVNEQIDIGQKLIGHRFIVFGSRKNDNRYEFYGLPDYNYRLEDNQDKIFSESLIIQNFSESNVFPGNVKGNAQAWAFRYFGGAGCSPITFEDLAKNEEKSSFTRLGVVRMDVDNLGKLFIDGFKEWDENEKCEIAKNASFSAYATFSGLLDLFFSGYLNTLRNKKEYKDHLDIIYSGGDDVFAIGRWDVAIKFAAEVRDEFRVFTGRNDITISTGIELITPKFPISKAAENAGNAENLAKHFITTEGLAKNAVCILEIPVNWDTEWPLVIDLESKLKNWLGKGFITKGLLMFLLRLFSKWKHNRDIYNKEDFSWKWIAAYNIARRQKKQGIKENENMALEELKKILFTGIGSKRIRFEVFALACRLVELETRTQK